MRDMKRFAEAELHIDSVEEDDLHDLLASGDVVDASELRAAIRALPDDPAAVETARERTMRATHEGRGSLPAMLIIALAAAAMIFGIARGEPALALRKAIRICLECIGIG